MRAKQANATTEAMLELAIRTAGAYLERHGTADLEDAFWISLCDEHWAFPGDGPPNPDTSRPRIHAFAVDYTCVWYDTTSQKEVQQRIQKTLIGIMTGRETA